MLRLSASPFRTFRPSRPDVRPRRVAHAQLAHELGILGLRDPRGHDRRAHHVRKHVAAAAVVFPLIGSAPTTRSRPRWPGGVLALSRASADAARPDMAATRRSPPLAVGEPPAGPLQQCGHPSQPTPSGRGDRARAEWRVLPSLAPGVYTARYAAHRPPRHQVGPLTMAQSDPLRLVMLARARLALTLAVHPRAHVADPVPTGRFRADGPTSSTPAGRHRLPQPRVRPGDDLRLIHWRPRPGWDADGPAQRAQRASPDGGVDNSDRPYSDESFEDACVAASPRRVCGATALCRSARQVALRPPTVRRQQKIPDLLAGSSVGRRSRPGGAVPHGPEEAGVPLGW
jgi:hypothetical protein